MQSRNVATHKLHAARQLPKLCCELVGGGGGKRLARCNTPFTCRPADAAWAAYCLISGHFFEPESLERGSKV